MTCACFSQIPLCEFLTSFSAYKRNILLRLFFLFISYNSIAYRAQDPTPSFVHSYKVYVHIPHGAFVALDILEV